ncbi:cold-shock protein [Actinacidiphila glaucinigra]|uniref:cold-shock protein n=1 Tax=Actinacidiphila glaucinigra TaxID=235986 RepID=UPI0033B38358
MARGTVKWFSSGKGTGFIKPDDGGPDVFVHYSQVQNYGYRGLVEDDQVEYEVGNGATGPQATKVTVVR